MVSPGIPLGGISGPSVWALGGYPQGLSPFFLCFSVFIDALRLKETSHVLVHLLLGRDARTI